MSDYCETVRIKSDNPEHEGGFVVINKKDFDPEQHEDFDAKPKKVKKNPPPEEPSESDSPKPEGSEE